MDLVALIKIFDGAVIGSFRVETYLGLVTRTMVATAPRELTSIGGKRIQWKDARFATE